MKTKTTRNGAILCAAVTAMLASQASAADLNLVKNGGFEDPVSPGWSSLFNLSGSTAIPHWNITSGTVDIVKNDYWNVAEGTQSLDLNGMTPGTIQQTVSGITAGKYRLSFYYGGNFEITTDTDTGRDFQVSIGGNTVGIDFLKAGGTGATFRDIKWKYYSQDITLAASDNILTFQSLVASGAGDSRDPRCGPVIDAVSLTAVPEPYQYGLASMVGLFGLLIVDRVRQRKLNR